MRLTERDLFLLKILSMFQCMTTLNIANLFDMNLKICQRRLRKLVNSGYLQSLPVASTKPGKSPYLFYLEQRSALEFGFEISKPRFTRQLSHQQKNTCLMIEIINSFKNSEIKCEVLPEHVIRMAGEEVIPDGAFMLSKKNKTALFLLENYSKNQILKSPKFNNDIETKTIRLSELFEGNDMTFYENFFETKFERFRVLFLANSYQRMISLSNLIKEHDSQGFVYISTLNEFNKYGIAGNIWQVPALNKINVSIIGS